MYKANIEVLWEKYRARIANEWYGNTKLLGKKFNYVQVGNLKSLTPRKSPTSSSLKSLPPDNFLKRTDLHLSQSILNVAIWGVISLI